MRMKAKKVMPAAMLMAAIGCGEVVEHLEPVAIDKLPGGALEAADKALPGVKFDRARKVKFNGQDAFEIIGKDGRGKTREVEISTEGKVLDIE